MASQHEKAAKKAHEHIRGQLRGGADDAAIASLESGGYVNMVSELMGKMGMGAFMLPALAAKLTEGIGWVGKKTGWSSAENAGTNANKAVTGFFDKKVGDVLPSLGEFGERVSKSGGEVPRGYKTALGEVTSIPSEWRAGRLAKKIASQTENIGGHVNNLPTNIRGIVSKIFASSKDGNIDHHEMSNLFAQLDKEVPLAKGMTAAEQAALDEVNKVVNNVRKLSNSRANVSYLSNPIKIAKDLPSAIAKSNVAVGVANTAFMGVSALGMYGAVQGFGQNLKALKQMYKDVTGKEASTLSMLVGDVPAPIAAERGRLEKAFAVNLASSATGFIAAAFMALKGRMSLMAGFAPMAVGVGLGSFLTESSLPYYTSLKQAHASGEKLSADVYAELIGRASPELLKRGGPDSPFTKAIAAQYAAESAAPALVMKEISSPKLLQARIDSVIAANEAAKTAAPVAAASEVVAEQPAKSHVAALTEPKAHIQKEMPIVGEHTKRFVADAQHASQAIGTQAALNGV